MKGTYTSLAALAAVANARNLAMPAITGTVVLPLDGFSPMPTAPPGLHELMRRANSESSELETVYLAPDNTCGYVSGRPGAGYTCFGTSVTCVFFTSASTRNSGAIACCDDLSCNLRVSCIDYNGYYSSSQCDDGCQVDAYTLKWYVTTITPRVLRPTRTHHAVARIPPCLTVTPSHFLAASRTFGVTQSIYQRLS